LTDDLSPEPVDGKIKSVPGKGRGLDESGHD
jgi:hypothetical protein